MSYQTLTETCGACDGWGDIRGRFIYCSACGGYGLMSRPVPDILSDDPVLPDITPEPE